MEIHFMCLVVQERNANLVHAIGPKIFQLLIMYQTQKIWYTLSVHNF